MKYIYECLMCGEKFEVIQSMNDEHISYHCGIESRRVFTIPHTNKDLMYNFTALDTFKEGKEIHSKRQYERLCKKEKLIPLSPGERKSLKPVTHEDLAPKRKKCAERMMRKIAQDGLMSKFKKLQDVLPTEGEK